MNTSGNEQLDAVLQKDYTVDVEKYFRKGWEVMQPNIIQMVGFFLIIAIVSSIPGVGVVAAGPLVAGFTFVVLAILRGKSFVFNDFFKGFTNKYFLQLFLVYLVSSLLIAIGMLFLLIPGIYLAVSYIFAIQFAVDWDLEFWPALETSRTFVAKQLVQVFILSLALVALNFVGALCLGIGMLVTVPLSFCIIVSAYDDLAGNRANDSTRSA
ncbi:Integral membrane protein [Tumidithrix helvetica PCC 7403]|uniref:hypothetical protein n=1 Tax=Tumidithrix helvetica TaxID=3457545 RepID=UPI003CBA1AB9